MKTARTFSCRTRSPHDLHIRRTLAVPHPVSPPPQLSTTGTSCDPSPPSNRAVLELAEYERITGEVGHGQVSVLPVRKKGAVGAEVQHEGCREERAPGARRAQSAWLARSARVGASPTLHRSRTIQRYPYTKYEDGIRRRPAPFDICAIGEDVSTTNLSSPLVCRDLARGDERY